jgi:hypothetical protein
MPVDGAIPSMGKHLLNLSRQIDRAGLLKRVFEHNGKEISGSEFFWSGEVEGLPGSSGVMHHQFEGESNVIHLRLESLALQTCGYIGRSQCVSTKVGRMKVKTRSCHRIEKAVCSTKHWRGPNDRCARECFTNSDFTETLASSESRQIIANLCTVKF